ncbi:MAG: hypothetical protein ACKVS5_13830 [Parvularculaceae bacterium]
MPRSLSSLLIAIGFLALVAMALLPSSVTIMIEVNDSSTDEIVYGAHALPAEPRDDSNL